MQYGDAMRDCNGEAPRGSAMGRRCDLAGGPSQGLGAERWEDLLRQSLGGREKVEKALRAKIPFQSADIKRRKGQLSLSESRVESRDSDMHAQRHKLAQLRG